MASEKKNKTIRVLVIDDSAYNRQAITSILKGIPGIEVVGRASDGEDGLKQALYFKPDLITLDLNMPRLDGFSFLRIIMSKQPTPVIVISSDARKESIFQALELGAVDFVVKASLTDKDAWRACADQLVSKLLALPTMHARPRLAATRPMARTCSGPRANLDAVYESIGRLVVIGSSTGGPAALMSIMQQLPFAPDGTILIAQHMPRNFTQAFAKRLDGVCPYCVSEARDRDMPLGAHVYLAPGGQHLRLDCSPDIGHLLAVSSANEEDRYAPSVDELFKSVARCWEGPALGVVLTGMGNDGALGVVELHERGVSVYAEAEDSAVIFGMPKEAWMTGSVKKLLHLDRMGALIGRFLTAS